MAPPEVPTESQEHEKVERESTEDARMRAQAHIQRIFAEQLVMSGAAPAEASKVLAEALKLVQDRRPSSKYFTSAPKLQTVSEIDKAAQNGSQEDKDRLAIELCGDFFLLCMALKQRPGLPTSEDANVDWPALDRLLGNLSPEASEKSLEALSTTADAIAASEELQTPSLLRAVMVMLAHPGLGEPGDFEALKKICALVARLHRVQGIKDILVKWYSKLPLTVLESRIGQVQQFITLSLLEAQGEGFTDLNDVIGVARKGGLARHVRNSLRLMDICWGANKLRLDYQQHWTTRRKAQLLRQQGQVMEDEGASSLDFVQFHNDAINECGEGVLKHDLKEVLEMQYRGHFFAKVEDEKRNDFGIVEFPFVLTPVSKVRMLSIESLLLQREEVRNAMALSMMLRGSLNQNPWLVLKVKRTSIVEDALQQLAMLGQNQLKKPLKIVFDGEEGVDEGGVQKEFFQLLVEELYNEDFGMFERIDESRNFWFNKNSFEASLQFELFGTVLGLAIYNQVILDVHFPMAIYKKLMLGTRAELGLQDLLDFQPSLAQGLIALLEHEDSSTFQETFGPLRFAVAFECFGSLQEAELKEGGKDIEVTFENREEYVRRYCDYTFNSSIERQYNAFRKGFDQCVSGTLFRQLFRYDELELLICGSKELDFRALETAATYQDGFTSSSDPVRWFWEVVHDLSPDEKKSLLQFCTGCDRAPVGGLGRLQLILSRAGPDSDVLPTVHTCFNHLLLPDYKSKEKLESLLRLAIQHCHGFGLM